MFTAFGVYIPTFASRIDPIPNTQSLNIPWSCAVQASKLSSLLAGAGSLAGTEASSRLGKPLLRPLRPLAPPVLLLPDLAVAAADGDTNPSRRVSRIGFSFVWSSESGVSASREARRRLRRERLLSSLIVRRSSCGSWSKWLALRGECVRRVASGAAPSVAVLRSSHPGGACPDGGERVPSGAGGAQRDRGLAGFMAKPFEKLVLAHAGET